MLNFTVAGESANMQEPSAPMLMVGCVPVFPFCLSPISVDGELNLATLRQANSADRQVAIFPELPGEEDRKQLEKPEDFATFTLEDRTYSAVGVLARVIKTLNFPDGGTRLLVRGLKRIKYLDSGVVKQVRYVHYENVPEYPAVQSPDDKFEGEALKKVVENLFQRLSLVSAPPEELRLGVANSENSARLADLLADSLNFTVWEKILMLAQTSVNDRLKTLCILLQRESEVADLSMKIQSEVHEAMSQSQREFYLREQLRAIQQELKEDSRNPDIIELEEKMAKSDLPEKVAEVVKRELSRLEVIPQNAPEYHISYTYVSWLLDMPWRIYSEDKLDVVSAAKILDADHYGLRDVKDRILEFLAVLELRKGDETAKAPILCLVGPPGVGKTSLGQSIARSMGRKFVRFSLGGMRDEAEIRGHRRTYVGAMPGRIIQNIKKAGTNNPVFMLDEIDKLASDFRGDPASALLEVLDPAQNKSFNDHYLELDYDLSKVFFIATANTMDSIPDALIDRMEIIRIPGYTSLEKREIAKKYLVPRQLKENGLENRKIRINVSAINEIIDYYTREAGVRQLERTIARVCRKLARKMVAGEISDNEPLTVNGEKVRELLGIRKYLQDEAERRPEIGCVMGMAWTSVGGVILPVEAEMIPGGKGELKLTGSLGKVMQESAAAAYTFVRSHADKFKIDLKLLEKNDIHIHVPDGATPKDGPSAGVTMTTALVSLLGSRKVDNRLAMTGEITLHGKVTAIGGVREKVIAAFRAGMKRVILPKENAKDATELPDEVKKNLQLIFVSRVEEVVDLALNFNKKPEKK